MNRDKILETVMGYRPIDDNFMNMIFKNNKPLVEYVLRIILDKNDLIVETSETQFDLNIAGSRGLILDVFAKDTSGKSYNIEVQRSDKGALPQRARYHASAIDVTELAKGSEYEELPDTYVIFITENDVLKGNKATYTVKRMIEELGEPFNDGTYIVYVNAAYQDVSTSIGKLIHDFVCKDPGDMLCEPMSEIAKHYKETTEGVTIMCKAVEDLVKMGREEGRQEGREEGREEGRQEGREEGLQEGIIKTIKGFIKDGTVSLDKIAEVVNMPVDEIKEIAASMT